MNRARLFLWICISLHSALTAQTFPAGNWEINNQWYKDGWDWNRKQAFQQYIIDSTRITGLVIVHKGKLVHSYGDIADNSYIASCRKSVLAMIYGKYVLDGTIDLDKTLADLGIDDVTPLLPVEKKARIRDLISARSGVFLTGSNAGDLRDFAPERGSVEPGDYWLYSNWDFNLAGHIFEMETGKNIYDEVEEQLAIPLSMQDWNRSLQDKSGDTNLSRFPAYHMWFSARDLARIGLLMLNNGKWDGQQVLAEEWVREMTSQITSSDEVNRNAPFMARQKMHHGYGHMWWLWENVPLTNLNGAYSALGAWGQSITIFPEIDVVLAIKTNSVYRRANQGGILINVIIKTAGMYDTESGRINKKLAKGFSEGDVNETIRYFKNLSKAEKYSGMEYFLNMLGYELLGRGEIDRAIPVFRLNTEEYPDSWNAWDSLGEGCETAGDTANAIKYYRKSLEINPDNLHGQNRLKSLSPEID